ncbi:MAG: hypothetical protein QOJ76_1236, partial [Acidobacteriota bacterium]|nr:hypothetical protein [Acidobacteriota bacterium]
MAHVGVALLFLNSATAPLAQRRRRSLPPPSHARTRVTAPTRPNAPAPAHTTTTQTPPASAQPTQQPPQSQQPQQPQPTPTPTQHRREPDLALEEMLAADSYSVYAEVRNVGTLARAEELKTAVGALALFGDETKPLTDLFAFVSDNAETLAAARIVVTFLPARSGLPQTLVAVELASSEEAIAFEPKFRRLVGEQVRAVKQAIDPQPLKQAESNTSDPSNPHRTPTKQLAELKAQTKAETKTETRTENKAETKTSAPGFALRRAGRWLIVAESPFTLKRLRGEEGEARFADSPRFQAVRGRFGSSALFVYVDTNVAQQGWALQQQKDTEAEANATLTATTTNNPSGVPITIEQGPPQPVIMPPVVAPTATTLPQSTDANTPAASATPTPTDPEALEQSDADDKEAVSEAERSKPSEVEENLNKLPPPPKPTEEQLAVSGMGGVLRNLWGGIPRIPGAVALGVGLERGAVALRLAVENTPDGTIA